MKNIRNICLVILLTAPAILFGQDVIITNAGDQIVSKVLEVSPTEIRYKKFSHLDGPTVIIPRTDVRIIKYENGATEVFSQPAAESPVGKVIPVQEVPEGPQPVKLGGPRVGVTIVDKALHERVDDIFNRSTIPLYSQFGWQFETRFFTLPDGFSGVVEIVPLIGGFEQGLFLPSISGLVGVRTGGGVEFGVGPNISMAGTALVIAAGVNIQSKYVNFPINFAVVPSGKGMRYSVLFGFNLRQ